MRAHLLMLAALLCSPPALGLQCHTCTGTATDNSCFRATCLPGFNACFKATLSMTGYAGEKPFTVESSGCAPSCEQVSQTFPGAPTQSGYESTLGKMGLPSPVKMELKKVRCCHEDLCNRAAPAGRVLGTLAAGLLLFWALL